MKDIDLHDVRTFVLLGHTGSGKTSLSDALLFKLGANDRAGSPANGTSMADYTEEEIHRKISIYAKPFSGAFKSKAGKKIQLTFMDTPGYDDFSGQVISAVRAADAALIAVDAVAGIQVGTTRAWRRAHGLGLPRGIVVTGCDRENADFQKVLDQIVAAWGNKCLPVVIPLPDGSNVLDLLAAGNAPAAIADTAAKGMNALIEKAAESEDALIEKFLGGEPLSPDELARGLRQTVRNGNLVPVFAAMTAKGPGIVELMENLERFFPSPAEGIIKDAAGKPVAAGANAPFVGWVWRTVTDPYAGKLAFVRVCGGTLKADSEIHNASKGHKERVTTMFILNGKKQIPVTEAFAGDIVALAKLKDTGLGDALCAVGQSAAFAPLELPHPVVSYAVSAKERSDEDKIGVALSRVSEDDPTLRVERHMETHELVLSGMGDVHLEIAMELMKKRSNVNVEMKVPKVAYKETVTGLGDAHYKHKKQSGGRGQYAEVYCKVQPKKAGEDWFEDAVVGGVIPRNFIPACQKGFVEATAKGCLAGYPVQDVKITVYDGSYHEVDSSEIAFKIAASRAFKDAMSKAKPVLLEPIMQVKVAVPGTSMGEINSDLNHKRGRILGVEVEDGMQLITAEVPLAEMFRYSSELRSITGGRGSFEMKPSRQEIVPSLIAQKIIAGAEKTKGEDED
ncbi:MAG: elongation factor G [Lentisphaerae bacterium]|nr:elongation factor G [Lentisphaerota bacterium]